MSQEQHPAFSVERIAWRERLGLRIVREEEEGRNIANQAKGVYGFTGAPSSEELPLFIKPVYRCFEVHTLAGGEIAIVGYLTEQEEEAFRLGLEPVTVTLYPDPHGASAKLAAIPLSRMDRRRPPSRDDGNPMVVDVSPAV